MDEKKDIKESKKLVYEVPELVSLSGVAGAGACLPGSGDGTGCFAGNAAGQTCYTGDSAGTVCSPGAGV